MDDHVNIAIIDATADGGEPAGPDRWGARYVTPIANLPLIYHVVDELAESGIRGARIVTSQPARPELERALGGGGAWGTELSYVDSPPGDGLSTVLAEINSILAAGPVLVHPGDCLFPRQVASMYERLHAEAVDLVLLGTDSSGGPGTGLGDSVRVCETPVLLAPSSRPAIEELAARTERGGNLVDSLADRGLRIAISDLGEHWFYSGSSDGLLAANRMMLDVLPVPAVDGEFGEGNRVRGRVAISPTARISNCTLYGPLVIDERAVVEQSFVGPYTAIGPDAVVTGVEIDNSMVLAGAQIRHPGLRIEASIIGEQAAIIRSFDLPKGLHLRLGPHSSVILS